MTLGYQLLASSDPTQRERFLEGLWRGNTNPMPLELGEIAIELIEIFSRVVKSGKRPAQ
jgi:hypothetical protein